MKNKKISVVDYGLGNIFSIRQALLSCGVDVVVTDSADVIDNSDAILLPGVGAFSDAMNKLRHTEMDQLLVKQVQKGKPLLGICLGLQLLFETSEEFGSNQGLSLIKGNVIRFPESYKGNQLNIPFIGWNRLVKRPEHLGSKLLNDIGPNQKFYFVHSYHVRPVDQSCIVAECNYLDYVYPAIVQSENISGMQGHPEKSAEQGLLFYKNWIATI